MYKHHVLYYCTNVAACGILNVGIILGCPLVPHDLYSSDQREPSHFLLKLVMSKPYTCMHHVLAMGPIMFRGIKSFK